ncbi:hypothetical protein Mic7113_0571 [Allocoleopsis franciscana PCC 7113]|uniref:Uncharacterized protein n=1 Tax=Allocoleopsis franciscana PCC 7113 TaxID=1173027 RepID=K9WAF4_9CYAN|nr:hypothetical protein Mic7113_0571 [Allocoleopsis franciscana PCC 7113]
MDRFYRFFVYNQITYSFIDNLPTLYIELSLFAVRLVVAA